MRVLITGNMGYVGSVLAKYLRSKEPSWSIVGYDAGYFAHLLTGPGPLPETQLHRQVFGDVRDIGADVLDAFDAVVHLAAVSNDPMGREFESVTEEVNWKATVRLAGLCARHGVHRFVFASSCSIYGAADAGVCDESAPVNPLTAYARSKVQAERSLSEVDLGGMVVTALRFATACGWSPRMRLDLVLNDFVASALSTGMIKVLSDGTPWRPLIDVEDMARAIHWALVRSREEGGELLALNTGSTSSNWQVRELAEAVAAEIPGTEVVINHQAQPDRRSYRVDFSRFEDAASEYKPRVSLEESVRRLRRGLEAIGFRDAEFRRSPYMRLQALRRFRRDGILGEDLRWRLDGVC